MTSRIGLIVNPIAGMGGPAGLAGTDGARADRAASLGVAPTAARRALRAMRVLAELQPALRIVAPADPMGAQTARAAGLDVETIWTPSTPTSASDTVRAAQIMASRSVDLIVFAGGDGTAVDIASALDPGTPILGIPTGVKMHSSVFALTPEQAGLAAARHIAGGDDAPLIDREVLDRPEDGPTDRYPTRLMAVVRCPAVPGTMQAMKQAGRSDSDLAVAALARQLAADADLHTLYIVGPGTTTALFLGALGLPATVTGVDLVRAGKVLVAGAGEREIYDAVQRAATTRLLLGVVGGQGFLLGRGNQQLSARVIDAVGADQIDVLAAEDKLAALTPPVLHVDLGTDRPIAALSGYLRVRTGTRTSTMMRVG